MGLIAPGMIRRVTVTVLAKEQGSVKDILHIVTKSDVFKIPIEATILSPDAYEREMQEQKALNKNLTNSRVRERLTQSIQKGRQSMSIQDGAKPKKRQVERQEGEEEGDYLDENGEMSPGDEMEMDAN